MSLTGCHRAEVFNALLRRVENFKVCKRINGNMVGSIRWLVPVDLVVGDLKSICDDIDIHNEMVRPLSIFHFAMPATTALRTRLRSTMESN